MNPYRTDAELFLKRSLDAIREDIDFPSLVGGLADLAFGLERVFKAILYDINPIYVLQDDSFKNSAAVFYGPRFSHASSSLTDVVTSKPNSDVISFRTALFRACLFSGQVAEHRGRLMAINNIRDTIAHRPLSELDEAKCRVSLLGDALAILKELEAGRYLDLKKLAGGRLTIIEKIAIEYNTDIDARVVERLEHHRKLYKAKVKEYPDIDAALGSRYKPGIDTGYLIECPACGNTAEVETDVDYDVMDGEAVPVGEFVEHLHCKFCDLDVTDFEELEKMKITMEALYSMLR
jgi:hypothetical protein